MTLFDNLFGLDSILVSMNLVNSCGLSMAIIWVMHQLIQVFYPFVVDERFQLLIVDFTHLLCEKIVENLMGFLKFDRSER